VLKLFACSVLAAFVACAGLPAQAGTPKDTLVEAWVIDDLVSLDPAEIFEASSTEYLAQVYDRLIGYDRTDASKIVPILAESWTVSDDGVTYTFKIRDGVKFASGNPLTARDAAWSLQRAIKLNLPPAYIVSQFGLTADNIDRMVTAPDDRTLVFKTDKAYAPTFVLNCLTSTVTAVVDSKLVKAHEVNGDFGHGWLKTASAGSGPFKLASWKPSELLALDRNDGYWQGQPAFRRVFIRHVPDASTRFLLLQQGDVDVARNLTPDQLKSLAGNADITLEPVQKQSIFYLSVNVLHPPFDKPEVRQALKYLVDYQGIVDSIMHGIATVHQTLVPAGMLGAIDDAPFSLDVAKARALLAQAGLPDGFKTTMDVINQSPYIDIAQAVQASFARAGVMLELIPGDARQVLTKERARNHDVYIGRWGPDYEDPDSNAGTFAINTDNGDNPASKTTAWANGWQDAALTTEAQRAVLEPDSAKRAQIYADLQRKHMDVSPFAFMFQLSEVIASRKTVEGLTWSATYDRNLYWTGRKP
jgi:peptide/nickel transport system substrate-binding protein